MNSTLEWNDQSSKHTETIQIKGSWQVYQAMSAPRLKRTKTPKHRHHIVKNVQSSATTDVKPFMCSGPHISYRMAHIIVGESNQAKIDTKHQIPFSIHLKATLETIGLSSVHQHIKS
jgi:hypothetical protein